MLQVGLRVSGGGDSSFQDWGFVFGTGKEPKTSTTAPKVVSITLQQSSNSNEVCGTVQQLFEDKEHHGLIVELSGTLQLQNCPPISLLSSSSDGSTTLTKSTVYQLLNGNTQGDIVVSTKAHQKFPFKLILPNEPILPPSFECRLGWAQYKIIVSMRVNKNWKFLGEKSVYYFGQLTLTQTIKPLHPLSCQITAGNLITVLEIPKNEFLPNEAIPFNIKFNDPDKGSVKKLSIILMRTISFVLRKEENEESEILDVMTFKRFLKRESFSRNGKFKGKIPTASYFGDDNSLKVKVLYKIQLKVTTKDLKTAEEQIEVVIGTDDGSPNPSAPVEEVQPTAPIEGEETPSAPARRQSVVSLASSMLSLLPPAYSNLSSRAGSILSLESLPPHYDDLSSP